MHFITAIYHFLLFRTMETRPPVGTHTTTPPGATSAVGGGLAHIHQPTRRLLNTTPCCARAASCIPCLLRCNALLQQQITIAATLLSITPHNTPASCAGAFAEQTPLLPPTIRRAALSDAPARTAFLFALLNAHHVAQHVVKIAAQRHLRGDHLPRRDFRARFRARTPRATPRHLCLLRPARQQTARNISGSLLIIQHHLPSCSATACGTSEWTIFPGTTSARDFKYECHVSRRAPLASYDLRASRPSTTSTACSPRYPQHPSPCSASARRAREPRVPPPPWPSRPSLPGRFDTKTPETHGLSG